MIIPIILPQLGDTMDQATLTRWYKREGEAVRKGEPLFELLTDKANIDVEATTGGYLRAVLCVENETRAVGEIVAYLTTTADEPFVPGGRPADDPKAGESAAQPPARIERNADAASQNKQLKPFVSPRARRLAEEQGIDLALVTSASKSGRLVEADVVKFLQNRSTLAASAPPPQTVAESSARAEPLAMPPSAQDRIIPVIGVRRVIFERMSSSAREVARVTLTTEADATALVELRQQINAAQAQKFSFTVFLALLTARALVKHPYMNATLQSDGIHQHPFVNLGFAIDTERGLLVPVIRDAHLKGLGLLAADLKRLGDEAQSGRIQPDELKGATFTLTNLGQYEIDAFTPIVNQPESAILGIGRIAQKPAAHQGQLALRWMTALSLSFDHRLVDGAPAAGFLQQLKHLIETPALVLV